MVVGGVVVGVVVVVSADGVVVVLGEAVVGAVDVSGEDVCGVVDSLVVGGVVGLSW